MRDADGCIAGYVLVPEDISTRWSTQARYEVIMISRTKIPPLQKGWEAGNPDLQVDSEATALEKQHFPDQPDINTSRYRYQFVEQGFDAETYWCLYNITLCGGDG